MFVVAYLFVALLNYLEIILSHLKCSVTLKRPQITQACSGDKLKVFSSFQLFLEESPFVVNVMLKVFEIYTRTKLKLQYFLFQFYLF